MSGRIHQLKSWPGNFEAVWTGKRPFDVRYDDRGFLAGDVLVLQEWDNTQGRHTGREIVAKVTEVWNDWHLVGTVPIPVPGRSDLAGLAVVVMGVKAVSWRAHPAQEHAVRPETLI